jgi:hypothetical protein
MVVWMVDPAPRHPFKRIAIASRGPYVDPNSHHVFAAAIQRTHATPTQTPINA